MYVASVFCCAFHASVNVPCRGSNWNLYGELLSLHFIDGIVIPRSMHMSLPYDDEKGIYLVFWWCWLGEALVLENSRDHVVWSGGRGRGRGSHRRSSCGLVIVDLVSKENPMHSVISSLTDDGLANQSKNSHCKKWMWKLSTRGFPKVETPVQDCLTEGKFCWQWNWNPAINPLILALLVQLWIGTWTRILVAIARHVNKEVGLGLRRQIA